MSVTYIVGTPDFHLKGRYDCLKSRLFPSLGSVFDVLRVPLFEGLDLRDVFMDCLLFYSFGKRGHRAITCCMLAFHNLTSGHVTRYTTSYILNMQKHLLLLHLKRVSCHVRMCPNEIFLCRVLVSENIHAIKITCRSADNELLHAKL